MLLPVPSFFGGMEIPSEVARSGLESPQDLSVNFGAPKRIRYMRSVGGGTIENINGIGPT